MATCFPIGEEDFVEIRQDGKYYVDKTEIIYELVNQTSNKVTLFTRPRRFGKTLTMRMMETFFDRTLDSTQYFDGLKIMEHPEFVSKWMNKYPVLFLSLKDVEGLTFETSYAKLKARIASRCIKYAYLAQEENVDDADKEVFQRLKYKKASDEEIQNSLETLMRMMYSAYGEKVILLIDEYDVPLAKASEKNTTENQYYERMLEVIRGMLSAALKTNEYLKFAVVTGCLRIAKESIFTGTNNFASYSVLDQEFSEYFGFTQEEVDGLLRAAGRWDKRDTVREWYNGYIFGKRSVYCPWDVMSYVAALSHLNGENIEPENYWKNTSHNGILLTFVNRSDFKVDGKFETLMNDGTIVQSISDELTYDTLHETEENLWSVLVMAGYLTKSDPKVTGNTVELRIPNKEIFTIFRDTVVRFFESHLDKSIQEEMMNAFWHGDEKRAEEMLSKVLYRTISYHDYHEEYYKAFLAGVVKGLGYEVTCEEQNGLGRTDTVVRDKAGCRALILEDKRVKSEKQMETACKKALKQIVDYEYRESLDDFDQVLCYGIAFYKKKAMVKMLR